MIINAHHMTKPSLVDRVELVSGIGFRVPSWGRENGFVWAEMGFVRRVPTKPLHGIEIGIFWVNPGDER